ncbi:MAG: T9SS type A sorting domain-containing protein, partial [Chitinophagales bacterium]
TAANGCDSVLTTNLTVLPNAASAQSISICDGESFFAGGTMQSSSGTYTDTFTAANGCDSVLTTNLTVLPNAASSQSISICDGESFFAGGAMQNNSGTYTDTFTAANGCDSVLTTNLTVLPVYSSSSDTTICLGDPYQGEFYNSDTVLIDSLLSIDGCDSVITTNVFVQQCCPVPILLCEDTIEIEYNQVYCGTFNLSDPDVDSPCNIVSLTNDYPGGPFPEGTTTVTWIATDLFGQSDTCQQTVVYQPSTLFSSYTLLAEEQVYLLPTNDVQRGAVGVMSPTGDAYLQNHTLVTGPGSFVASPIITTFPHTQVSNPIYSPANVTLPDFEVNPVPNSGADVTIRTNQTAVLTDTVYGRIRLFKGATVIFDNPHGVVNAKEIRVNHKAAGAHTRLEFKQCTKVRVKERVDLGPRCTINPDSLNVIFYVESANTDAKDNQPAVDIGPRAVVYADFYVPNGRFYAHPGTHVDPARYNGTFIAKWINGDPDIVWRRRADCDYDYTCPGNQFKHTSIEESTSEEVLFESYPNPFENTTTIKFVALSADDRVSLKVFDTSGKLVASLFEGKIEAGQENSVVFDASSLARGVYFTVLQTSKGSYYNKLVHIR